jgi:signal transduction histidine kinase
MSAPEEKPVVLEVFKARSQAPSYPWIGFVVGIAFGLLVIYPLHLGMRNLSDYLYRGASLKLLKAVTQGFSPRLWPIILFYALFGGLGGLVLAAIFKRLRENRQRLDTLHHEFELQVTTLRHHYKNLALGIHGFSARIKRKLAILEEHFRKCAPGDCATYGQFYQDFEALEQSVAILEDAAQRLSHTLGQEILFLRALTNETPTVSPRDFYPFLRHCLDDLLGLRFREKPIRVEINGRPPEDAQESLVFSFDPHIMEVILQNILSNAMKNGDYLQIQVEEQDNLVQVAISDNGPGMDLRELQRHLQDLGRRRDEESTHLGLKVSVHLLEKCRGRLLARSRPGEGACFIIEIPKKAPGWERETPSTEEPT